MTLNSPFCTVLGAEGFVGRHLVRYLRARDIPCRALGRGNPIPLDRPLGHVFYAIGLTNDYAARPFDTVEAHVSLFARLLREAEFDSVVYLSSTRLYDTADGPADESAGFVLAPRNPRHLYDLSKGLGEALGLHCGRQNVRVARLSCVYADDLAADNFLHQLLRRALSEPSITLDARPDDARDYVHIDDVCRALLAIATCGRSPVYNVASGVNLTNRELFRLVEGATGCHISVCSELAPGLPPPAIDISAMHEELGVSPCTPDLAIAAILQTLKRQSCSTTVC